MTRGEPINWIISLTATIGKTEPQYLWHYKTESQCESVQAQLSEEGTTFGKWIPCKERLPENGQVIVQYNDGDYDMLKFPTAYRLCDVIAWMPLPEPFVEDERR